MHIRIAALNAYVVIIVFNNILERTDVNVVELGQIRFDIVVEVDGHIYELGLVEITTRRTPILIPAIVVYKHLIIKDLGAVDNGDAGRFDQGEQAFELFQLLRLCIDPEALPKKVEDGAL